MSHLERAENFTFFYNTNERLNFQKWWKYLYLGMMQNNGFQPENFWWWWFGTWQEERHLLKTQGPRVHKPPKLQVHGSPQGSPAQILVPCDIVILWYCDILVKMLQTHLTCGHRRLVANYRWWWWQFLVIIGYGDGNFRLLSVVVMAIFGYYWRWWWQLYLSRWEHWARKVSVHWVAPIFLPTSPYLDLSWW